MHDVKAFTMEQAHKPQQGDERREWVATASDRNNNNSVAALSHLGDERAIRADDGDRPTFLCHPINEGQEKVLGCKVYCTQLAHAERQLHRLS